LRAELQLKLRTLPMFLRPQFGDLISKLDDWVESVESRLTATDARVRGIDKIPSTAALELLNRPAVSNAL